MTRSMSRQGPPPSGDGPAVRAFRMYRFYDERGVLLYVGITGRIPMKRLMEHVDTKVWSDLMCRWEVDPRIWPDLDAVEAAESTAIRTELPLFNIEGNLDNPLRIPPWEAQRQRAERDRAMGFTPAQRLTPTAPRQATTRPRQVSRRGPGRSKTVWTRLSRTLPYRVFVLWSTTSLLLAALACWATAGMGLPRDLLVGGPAVAVTAAIVRWWRHVKRLLRRRR